MFSLSPFFLPLSQSRIIEAALAVLKAISGCMKTFTDRASSNCGEMLKDEEMDDIQGEHAVKEHFSLFQQAQQVLCDSLLIVGALTSYPGDKVSRF